MRKTLFVFVCLFAFISMPVFAQPKVGEALTRYVERLPKSTVSGGKFSGYVIAMKNGEVVLSQGFASPAGVLPTMDSHFAIGSVTKHIIALEFLRMESEGKLSLSDPLSKYFRHLPKWTEKVTVQQLLNHTAGFANYTANPKFETIQNNVLGLSDILELSLPASPTSEPGTKWAYSNTHYFLLGIIIEKITGKTYLEQIREDLFKQAGVEDVDSYSKRKMLDGFEWVPDPENNMKRIVKKVSLPNSTGPYAAGEIAMSPKEAIQWTRYVNALDMKMLSKFTKGSKANTRYGLGVFTEKDSSWIFHGGTIDGFRSLFAMNPKTQSAVVVLGNCLGCGTLKIGTWVRKWLSEEKILSLPPVLEVVDISMQKRFAGKFQLDEESKKKILEISEPLLKAVVSTEMLSKDGDLVMQLVGQSPFIVRRMEGKLVGSSSIQFKEIEPSKGSIQSFVMSQGSLEVRYIRVPTK